MSTTPACHSMKKPRPLSAGFHHQPDSGRPACTGAVRPPGTNAWRSIAVLPPGQIIVPWVAFEKAKVTLPPPASAGNRYGPVSDWPPEAARKSEVKSEPSRLVAPPAKFHVAPPSAFEWNAANK